MQLAVLLHMMRSGQNLYVIKIQMNIMERIHFTFFGPFTISSKNLKVKMLEGRMYSTKIGVSEFFKCLLSHISIFFTVVQFKRRYEAKYERED